MNDIVVGVDPSETARRAAEKAVRLAAATGVNLHLVTCVRRDGGRNVGVGGDSWNVDPLTEGEAFLKDLTMRLPHDQITTAASFDGPAEAMLAEAERVKASMIVASKVSVGCSARSRARCPSTPAATSSSPTRSLRSDGAERRRLTHPTGAGCPPSGANSSTYAWLLSDRIRV